MKPGALARAIAIGLSLLAWACAPSGPERLPAPVETVGDPIFADVADRVGLDFVHVHGFETRYAFPEVMGGGVGLVDYDVDGDLDVYFVQSGDLEAPRERQPTNRLFRNDTNEGRLRFTDVTEPAAVGDRGYGMGCAVGDVDSDGLPDLYVTNLGPNVLYRNLGGGRFDDVTAAAGVGDPSWGTSAGFFDADEDGDLDLFVANYVGWSEDIEPECSNGRGERDYCHILNYSRSTADVLYRNEGDGTFHDVSVESGIASATGNGLGVGFFDADGDGHLDVYVANDLTPNHLWMNRGGLRFEDRGLVSGASLSMYGSAQAGMGVTIADVEDDGDFDLFVANVRNESNNLYVNSNGSFSDRTITTGIGAVSIPWTGFGAGFADFDLDGFQDVYVANGAVAKSSVRAERPYDEPNVLMRGMGGGRFEEWRPRGGTALPAEGNSRGAAFGDLDGDGDVDVVVVNNGEAVQLFENLARGQRHWLQLRVRSGPGVPAIGARVVLEGERRQQRLVMPSYSYCSSSDPRVHFGLGTDAGPVVARVFWADGSSEEFGPLAVDGTRELLRGEGAR